MLKTIPPILFPPPPPWLASNAPTVTASTGSAIDAAGEKYAMIFYAPKTGTIDRIRFATSAVSSSQDLSVSLETVSATDGFPTGTDYGGSAPETVASPAATTIYTVTFATPASATKGDVIAIVIEWAGATGNVQFMRGGTGYALPSLAYLALYTGAWADASVVPYFSVLYDDDTTEFIGCPPAQVTAATRSFHSETTPDEVGLRFKMPFGARATGVHGWLAPVAARENTLILYSDGGTSLASIAPDFDQANNTGVYMFLRFASPVTLTKDTWYRLTYRPDTGSAVNIPFFKFTDNIELGQFSGQDIYHCERTNAGSFTDDTGAFTPISLMLDAIDIPGVYMVNE